MTIIAYKDGVMAADTLCSSNGTAIGFGVKIARSRAGDLIGASGPSDWTSAMLEWFRAGERRARPKYIDKDGSFGTAIVVRSKYKSECLFFYGDVAVPEPSPLSPGPSGGFATGSGRDIAMGAMFAGASAADAVRAAMALESGCGGTLTILSHEAMTGRQLLSFLKHAKSKGTIVTKKRARK